MMLGFVWIRSSRGVSISEIMCCPTSPRPASTTTPLPEGLPSPTPEKDSGDKQARPRATPPIIPRTKPTTKKGEDQGGQNTMPGLGGLFFDKGGWETFESREATTVEVPVGRQYLGEVCALRKRSSS